MAVSCSKHYPGHTPDIDILKKRVHIYKEVLKKKGEKEINFEDNRHLIDKYPDIWALLLDKGYAGMADMLRCIYPEKKS